MQGKKHYAEKLFTSFHLSERIPHDNFYRRLKEELNLDFLYKSTADVYGTEGQKSIDPVVFFKLLLVGYLENLNSDRKIISHASMRLDILFFIGYDIDEELPWHSTLSRTRQLYGEDVFVGLFRNVLQLCVSKGMVGGKRQAVDSAFIKANASMDSIAEKQILDDANEFIKQLGQDDAPKTVSVQKKKEVEAHHQWKKREYKDQPGHRGKKANEDDHGNLIRSKFLSNHTHFSKTDSDARISVKPGKPRQFTYSAQACVDTRMHVITNMMADFSDKRDSQSLEQVVQQAKENLLQNNLKLEEILADAGYSSGKALRFLKEQKITGYIPNFGQYKNEREGFIYNKEKDQYECIRGNKAVLPLKRTAPNSNGYIMKVYRSSETVCKNCPVKSLCIGGKTNFKKIDDNIEKPLYDEMHERLKTDKAKRLKKLRSSTVEPVLGTLINFTGMRRVWTRGIKSANKFMLGAATAYNLKKWFMYNVKTQNGKIMSMCREAERKVNTPKNLFCPLKNRLITAFTVIGLY